MKQQRTVIEDLIFFIRNGVIDFKNYFIPLNAISYVNLIAAKGKNALSIEINSGRVFILQQDNVQFLTDFMNILKSCHDNPQAYYKIDVLRGMIYCNTVASEAPKPSDSPPEPPTDLPIPAQILSDLKDLQKKTVSTPSPSKSLSKSQQPKVSHSTPIPKPTAFQTRSAEPVASPKPAAFEVLDSGSATDLEEKKHASVSNSQTEKKPSKHSHPNLPTPGTGLGTQEHAPIGSGLTAMEIYANKKNSGSIPKAPEIPHSTIQAPHTTMQTAHTPPQKQTEPISIPKVEPPQRSQKFPRYYSASEFLRKHGELSDVTAEIPAPSSDTLPPATKGPKALKLFSKRTDRDKQPLPLSNKEWTDAEFYFFQKKTSYSKTDALYQLCEQLEDYAYKKDKDGLCSFLREMPADKLPQILDKKAIEQVPLFSKILREDISES